MKGWVMGVLLLVCSVSSPQAAELENPTAHDLCAQTSLLAEQIAKARYAGVPMRDLSELMGGNSMALSLVRDAYNLPDWSGEERQQRAMTGFGNDVYSVCIEQLEAAKADRS